jgi:hypothetical protein
MLFKKIQTLYYVYKLINKEVNDKYIIKITTWDPGAHKHSDTNAKNKIAEMIIRGDIGSDDVESICNSYMSIREALIIDKGDTARWVKK